MSILEIAPELSTAHSRKPDDLPDYPRYRVMVLGGYQKIAEFMQNCREQRIPVRVTDFRVSQTENQNFVDPELLKAEITVEAFRASTASLEQMKEI